VPQEGVQDGLLDGCRALGRGDGVSVADYQFAQRMAFQVPWILGESGTVDLQFCLSGPDLGVLA
jgi:hypothetical protein